MNQRERYMRIEIGTLINVFWMFNVVLFFIFWLKEKKMPLKELQKFYLFIFSIIFHYLFDWNGIWLVDIRKRIKIWWKNVFIIQSTFKSSYSRQLMHSTEIRNMNSLFMVLHTNWNEIRINRKKKIKWKRNETKTDTSMVKKCRKSTNTEQRRYNNRNK